MQRDVGNEVIVAILAVAVLAFALIFAIILSLSGGAGGGTVANNPTAVMTVMVPSRVEDMTEEPTAAVTASETLEPKETATEDPTATMTATAVRASATPTPSVTDTAAASATPRPTNTRAPTDVPTPTPRPSLTPRPTQTVTPSATSTTVATCLAPVGWRTYSAQARDTLASIAATTRSDLADLLSANCLDSEAEITSGQVIYVPRLPIAPQSTPRTAVENAPRPLGCTVPAAQITSPASGQRVSGVFRVVGTANIAQFAQYRIEIRPDFVAAYDQYEEFDEAVINGQLARIDTDAYGTGLHWVRLSVFSTLDSSAAVTCAIPMFFD